MSVNSRNDSYSVEEVESLLPAQEARIEKNRKEFDLQSQANFDAHTQSSHKKQNREGSNSQVRTIRIIKVVVIGTMQSKGVLRRVLIMDIKVMVIILKVALIEVGGNPGVLPNHNASSMENLAIL